MPTYLITQRSDNYDSSSVHDEVTVDAVEELEPLLEALIKENPDDFFDVWQIVPMEVHKETKVISARVRLGPQKIATKRKKMKKKAVKKAVRRGTNAR